MKRARHSEALGEIALIRELQAEVARRETASAKALVTKLRTQRDAEQQSAHRLSDDWAAHQAATPSPEMHAGWIGRSDEIAVSLAEAEGALARAETNRHDRARRWYQAERVREEAGKAATRAGGNVLRAREEARLNDHEDRALARWRKP